MRYAVLGAGGVGGLIGGALAHQGQTVTFIARPETVAAYPAELSVRSAHKGDFIIPARVAARLDEPIDALWVTVKSVDLDRALDQVSPGSLGDALVIPLLNGIEHLATLRDRYGDHRVVAGSVRVESEREAPGRIRHVSPFMSIELSPPGGLRIRVELIAAEVRATGITCTLVDDDASVMWRKLTMLAPNALTTAASGRSVQEVWRDPEWLARYVACVREACAVAAAEGVLIDPEELITNTQRLFVREHRTSMQKDVDAGRKPEVDAIGGAIVRRAERHGIAVPVTRELIGEVVARAASLSTRGAT